MDPLLIVITIFFISLYFVIYMTRRRTHNYYNEASIELPIQKGAKNPFVKKSIKLPMQQNKILVEKFEELYGGAKGLPTGITEENEEGALKIWNEAISECIKIIQNGGLR